MRSHVLWAFVAALVLTLAGGAAASNGGGSNRTSGHAAPPSKIAHPPLPAVRVKALTRKHLKARNTTGATRAAASRTGARAKARPKGFASLANVLANAIASAGLSAGPASFVTVPANGTPDGVSDESFTPAGFPADGSTFGILTNGDASAASQPNDATGTGTDDSCTPGAGCGSDGDPTTKGASRQAAHDVTILKMPLTVPRGGGNCLSFDFRYLSEEYPEFVSSPYNDAFVAELDKNTWTATGANVNSPITASANFAADISGRPVSTNAGGSLQMTAGAAAGTTYDGATPVLRASTPITAGSHNLYLSIFDQGDHFYDSAAFVDNLRLTTVPAGQCVTGAVVDETPADLSVVVKGSLGEGTVDYAVTVHNDGPAAAVSPSFDDELVFGLDYVGADGATCSNDDTSVHCALDTLDPGATAQFTIHTAIADGSSYFATESTVASSTLDPIQGNNEFFTYDGGGGPSVSTSDLAVASSAADQAQGSVVKIPVTITNNGGGDYSDGLFTETYVPKSLAFVGYALPESESAPDGFDGCYVSFDTDIGCGFEPGTTIANGDSFEIDLYAYVLRSGWITTETDLYTDSNEPNYTNNYSFASFSAAPTAYQSSNVAVTMTNNGDFVPSLGNIVYTIKLTNSGPAEAGSVNLTDDEPDGTTGQTVSDTLGSCASLVDGGIDCNIDLKSKQTDTITYTVQVDESAPDGEYVANEVDAIPGSYYDASLIDNYFDAYTVVAPTGPETADLVTKLTSTPGTASAGTPITTTASLTNKGPSAIQDGYISVFSYLLEDSLIVSSPAGCDWDDFGDYVCEVGPVAKSATKTVKIVWVPQTGGDDDVFANTFSTDLTWEDPNFANNDATTKLVVKQPVVDLGIAITDAVDPIDSGSNETYTITVTNQGYDPATGVQVLDVLPNGSSLVSASGKGFTCVPATVLTCTLKGTLAPGAIATITVVATLTGAGTATSTASVESTAVELDPSDNAASVSTAITPD